MTTDVGIIRSLKKREGKLTSSTPDAGCDAIRQQINQNFSEPCKYSVRGCPA